MLLPCIAPRGSNPFRRSDHEVRCSQSYAEEGESIFPKRWRLHKNRGGAFFAPPGPVLRMWPQGMGRSRGGTQPVVAAGVLSYRGDGRRWLHRRADQAGLPAVLPTPGVRVALAAAYSRIPASAKRHLGPTADAAAESGHPPDGAFKQASQGPGVLLPLVSPHLGGGLTVPFSTS